MGSVFKRPLSDLKFGGICRGNRWYFGAVRRYLEWYLFHCTSSLLHRLIWNILSDVMVEVADY